RRQAARSIRRGQDALVSSVRHLRACGRVAHSDRFHNQQSATRHLPGNGPVPGSNTDLHTPARPIAIASVTATQPLTQLIRIHLFVVEQRLKVDAAELSFSEREQKLTDDVRQSYNQVLQSQIEYESQQSMVKYLEELLQLTDRRFNQHAALEADRLSVKAEVAKATYQLTTIEDRLADRKEVLNHLLGRSVQTEFSVEPVPATLPDQ